MTCNRSPSPLIRLSLAVLLLGACGAPAAPGTATVPAATVAAPAAAAPPATATPVPSSTTAAPSPTAAAANPASDLGTATSSRWEVTLKAARRREELEGSGVSLDSPGVGYKYLALDVTLRNSGEPDKSDPEKKAAIVGDDGQRFTASNRSIDVKGPDISLLQSAAHCIAELSDPMCAKVINRLWFPVKEEAIGQPFKFYFDDAPPIPFSVRPNP